MLTGLAAGLATGLARLVCGLWVEGDCRRAIWLWVFPRVCRWMSFVLDVRSGWMGLAIYYGRHGC